MAQLQTTSGAQVASIAAVSHQQAVLAIVVISYLMIVIDISIVITGLPKIQQGLSFSHAGLSWVQNAYTLAFGGLLLLGARAGDIFGRRRMFILGLAVFTVASMAIGLAQSPAWLLGWRAIQGGGAAVLAPSTLALLSTHFAEGPERTRALSWYAAAAGVGASLGLVLGGLAADLISWRAGFFINLPIGLGLIWGARRFIAETPKRPGQLDLLGAVTSTIGMTALVFGIVQSAEAGWLDPMAVIPFLAGIALLAFFLFHESRARQPILPLRLFASRERAAAYGARVLFLAGMVGFWFFLTQYLQGVLHMRPLQAGLAFLPTTIPNFIAAILVPRLTRKLGHGPLLATGLALGVVGMAWLAYATAQSAGLAGMAVAMALIGVGQGGVLGPLTVSAVVGVRGEDAGAASGLVNVFHQLGNSIGLGVLVVLFAAVPAGLLAHQVAATLAASAVFLAVCLALVLAFIVRRKPQLA